MITKFADGLKNIISNFPNRRDQLSANVIESNMLGAQALRAVYKTGLANKIVRVKSSYALNNTMLFENDEDETFYTTRLEKVVRDAVTYMMAFGRGIIVIHHKGDDLMTPLPDYLDPKTAILSVFSGDSITSSETSRDIDDERFFKPIYYQVYQARVHFTRVIDFTYVEPTNFDKPAYQYGGISEYELIYNQLVSDAIVERASASILEKNSTLFYKIKTFRDQVSAKKDADIIKYFELLENARSIYGASILDAEDDVVSISQTLTNLKDINDNSLRRVAMVTDIPLAILIGENVKGLNSTGDNELKIFQDAIKNLQENYIKTPVNQLMMLLGRGEVDFQTVQWETPLTKVQYESVALDNAIKLDQLGQDFGKYLSDAEIVQTSNFDEFFSMPDEQEVDESLINANGN